MDGVVGPIKKYLLKSDPANIDNWCFQLHYRATFMVLIVSMMLVSARQYIGDPINCIAEGVPGGTMDVYCWIHSTFSVPSRWGQYGDEYARGKFDGPLMGQPHPGVAPLEEGETVIHHKYYQWVVFFLFVQAMLFHIPRSIWKGREGGLMKMLVKDMTNPAYLVDKNARQDQISYIIKYFKTARKNHGGYALNFFLCEVLALINVIGQIYFTDRFLGYTFTTYGWDVVTLNNMDPEERADPMNIVFPKVAKCTFHKYGPSGTIENKDGLCILALNIINEKIYVFLWFWFVALALISAAALVYRVLVILIPTIRVNVVMAHCLYNVDKNIVNDCLSSPDHSFLDKIGDYWVLYLLSKNLSPIAMQELLDELHPVLNPKAADRKNNVYPSLEKESTF